jgi:hypothetical protein
MAEIFNLAISKSDFSSFTAQADDFDPQPNLAGMISFHADNTNPITSIFNQSSPNRIVDKGQFFHFKSTKISKLILKNKAVQVSDLLSNDANDFAEYSEFFKRLGLFNNLMPEDALQQKQQGVYNPASPSKMDKERKSLLILCFTKNSHEERFWKQYVDDDHGVCFGLRVRDYNPDNLPLYSFRDVCYDEGYKFDFLNHINYHYAREFGTHLLPGGLAKFAKFYKRGKYAWEDETRLTFHYDFDTFGYGRALNNIFPLQTDQSTGRNYINLPLQGSSIENPLFTLTLDEVICGKNISEDDYQEIKSLVADNFPSAYLWKRM